VNYDDFPDSQPIAWMVSERSLEPPWLLILSTKYTSRNFIFCRIISNSWTQIPISTTVTKLEVHVGVTLVNIAMLRHPFSPKIVP